MAKTKKSQKKENLKTQPKIEKDVPGFASSGLGPATARCMVIKLASGEELVSLVASGTDHVREFTRDVNAKEKDPKMRKAIMESFNAEISDTLSIKNKKMEDVIVLYYPMLISYGQMVDQKKQLGSIFLQPWVSPSMSTTQIFFTTREQIVTMFEPAYAVKAYFSNAMSRLIVMITAAMSQDALSHIDPNSELGKLMSKLKQQQRGIEKNNPASQEEQEDEYVERMIAKSREPIKPETKETDQQNETPPTTAAAAVKKEENSLPSVTVGGIKKTLH